MKELKAISNEKAAALFAVLAMACRLSAAVVDPGFDDSLDSGGTYMAGSNGDIDAGWIEYDNGTQWDIVSGALKRNFGSSANAGRSVAQIFSDSLTNGVYWFNFEYNWTSTDTTGDIWVQLYLFDNLSGSASLSYPTRMDLTGTTQFTTPVGNADWTISELATSGNLITAGTSGSYVAMPLKFTITSDMGPGDLLGIRIGSYLSGGQSTATLAFDNFNIVPQVPEPASAGMLIIGALAVVMMRRNTFRPT